jgi:hypothetical protein
VLNDELDDVFGMNPLTMRGGQTALYIRIVALFLSATNSQIGQKDRVPFLGRLFVPTSHEIEPTRHLIRIGWLFGPLFGDIHCDTVYYSLQRIHGVHYSLPLPMYPSKVFIRFNLNSKAFIESCYKLNPNNLPGIIR